MTRALTTSIALARLYAGPLIDGVCLGRHHVAFDRYVVALTPPGGPLMPNGFETGREVRPGAPALAGGDRLCIDGDPIEPGEPWDPVPARVRPGLPALSAAGLLEGAGRGPGLTPAGDDLIAGYVAGLVLLHGDFEAATWLVDRARNRTTALSATLLDHAARGEVPEPVHDFLATGDTAPLLRMGHSSGRWWLDGLLRAGAIANAAAEIAPAASESVTAAHRSGGFRGSDPRSRTGRIA